MTWIASLIILLCSVFPPWVVGVTLSLITLVMVIILIKVIAFVLEAVPFL